MYRLSCRLPWSITSIATSPPRRPKRIDGLVGGLASMDSDEMGQSLLEAHRIGDRGKRGLAGNGDAVDRCLMSATACDCRSGGEWVRTGSGAAPRRAHDGVATAARADRSSSTDPAASRSCRRGRRGCRRDARHCVRPGSTG